MFCNYCRAINPEDSLFCSACGKSFPPRVHASEQPPEQTGAALADPSTAELDRAKFSPVYELLPDEDLLRLKDEIATLKEGARLALLEQLGRRNLGRDAAPATVQPAEGKLEGVGGWLAFLVLSLTIFSPLITVGTLTYQFSTLNPQDEKSAMVISSVLIIGLMCFGIYAGVRLLRIKQNAVQTAKRYLVAQFLFAALLIVLSMANRIATSTQDSQPDEAFTSGMRSMIGVIVWYSYLVKSKRVAATYPK